jgi:hypothetical protein
MGIGQKKMGNCCLLPSILNAPSCLNGSNIAQPSWPISTATFTFFFFLSCNSVYSSSCASPHFTACSLTHCAYMYRSSPSWRAKSIRAA